MRRVVCDDDDNNNFPPFLEFEATTTTAMDYISIGSPSSTVPQDTLSDESHRMAILLGRMYNQSVATRRVWHRAADIVRSPEER